jgi:NAD+ diphosphatase
MLASPKNFSALSQLLGHEEKQLVTLCFRGDDLLVDEIGERYVSTSSETEAVSEIFVGSTFEHVFQARALGPESIAPAGSKFAGLRSLFSSMQSDELSIALRSKQLLEWDRTHRFCGACGTPTIRETTERVRRCPACGLSAYPRISPAMMCLVTRGDEILLARNVNFPPGRYSALAGFLEAGESIEDAVHREVHEEVGIEVSNLRYFASQSWPFPHSLMIAFTAEYAGGELTPNRIEIAEAEWFSKDRLPQLPPRVSIARALIDETLRRLATA